MATIPVGVIILWPGTNAGIPAGWVRETDLDAKFIKATAAGVAPNVAGGTDTHTHTSPTHTHTADAHYHSGWTSNDGQGENDGGSSSDIARDNHHHDYAGTTAADNGNLYDAVTYAAGDSKPPYHDMIFIKPNGSPKALPANAITFYHKTTVPSGWTKCDGTNTTPNLTDKFIRGAGAGADAGTTGGSLNHSHSVNHTHTARTHSHAIGSGWDLDYNSNARRDTNPEGGAVCPRHTHTVYLAATTAESGSAYTATAGSADTVQPLHKKLLAIKNTTGAFSKPRWIIGLWLGSLTAIPQGWWLCDGQHGTPDMRDYYVKITNTNGDIATTAGANTHGHAASNSHTHTAGGTHSHNSGGTSYVGEQGGTGAGGQNGSKGHSHIVNSVSAATSSWQAATISGDSSNGEPAYKTAAFIMFDRELIGGLFNMFLSS